MDYHNLFKCKPAIFSIIRPVKINHLEMEQNEVYRFWSKPSSVNGFREWTLLSREELRIWWWCILDKNCNNRKYVIRTKYGIKIDASELD